MKEPGSQSALSPEWPLRTVLLAATIALGACSGRYARFTLPVENQAADSAAPTSFTWTVHPEPVLSRGAPGEFDSVDVLNPSVAGAGPKKAYINLYSGFDGKAWHTGLAESADGGMTWTKRGKVLSPVADSWETGYIAANGSLLAFGGKLHYWYQGGRTARIGLATASSAMAWTRHGAPVVEPGPIGSWDERGVADPYVIEQDGWLYMYYTGMDRAARQRLGVARSRDGVVWEKLLANPVMEMGAVGEFDEGGLGEPAVWKWRGSYWMLYTGRAWDERRAIGLARSPDGVTWGRVGTGRLEGSPGSWRSKVVCDPSVIADGDEITVWFGGGNVASPDERLNGAIGLAVLRMNAP